MHNFKKKIELNFMKKILKIIGVLIAIIIVATGIYYIANTEALPKGVQGKRSRRTS